MQITQVKENTYFAELHINRGDETIQVDARPSDSIAIALRLETPIFAQESLLTDISLQEADEAAIQEVPDVGPVVAAHVTIVPPRVHTNTDAPMTTFWPDMSVDRLPSADSMARPLRPVTMNAWLGPATL